MANIIGCHGDDTGRIPKKHLFLVSVVGLSLIGFMLISEQSWQGNLPALLATIAVILAVVVLALNRANPMAWKQLLNRAEYERYLHGHKALQEILQGLNDEYQVFCAFTFELIHVEFLVLCPGKIFVLGLITSDKPLQVNNGALMAGADSLEKLTSRLWRACHLVNLVVKKGYQKDLMPSPILVATGNQPPEVSEFDSIRIITPEQLPEVMKKRKGGDLPPDMMFGFTDYLVKRYFK